MNKFTFRHCKKCVRFLGYSGYYCTKNNFEKCIFDIECCEIKELRFPIQYQKYLDNQQYHLQITFIDGFNYHCYHDNLEFLTDRLLNPIKDNIVFSAKIEIMR